MRLQAQQRLQVLPENFVFFLLCKALEALYPGHRGGLPPDVGPIAAQDYMVSPDVIQQKAQPCLAVSQTVIVETTLVGAGRLLNVDTSLRTNLPTAVEATHPKAGWPSSMGDTCLEVGTGVENAPENQGSHDKRVFHQDTDTIGQAITINTFQGQIVLRLRMKEQYGTQSLSGLEEW
jgi:hypothetical protein